jgi:cell division protein FtsA
MTQKEEIFVGIDIGSSKTATVVAKKEGEDHLSIIGVGVSQMTGLKKGVVAEIEDTVSGISESVEIAERMAGVDISAATVNINGSHISSLNSNGVVGVGRADQQINKEDMIRAEDAAQAVQMSPNKEILHVFPRVYKVDDQEGIKDPMGMTGIRLEVDTHIVCVAIQASKNLHKVFAHAGVRIQDEIASPLASAKAVAKKRQLDLGCVVVDIGAATTGIAVYEEGEIYHTAVLPIGGMHITNDVAIGIRTSIDIAEKVKLKFGHCRHKEVSEKDKIDLSEIDIKEEGVISRRHLSEIIEARYEEILKMVREELKGIGREALLPAGAILTGGVSKMPGADEKAKEVLKLPVELGQPHNLFGITDKVYAPSMSAAVGLLLYNYEEALESGRGTGGKSGDDMMKKAGSVAKKIFKTFLP